VAKPDLNSYRPALKMLGREGNSTPWFAAAHLVWCSHFL
jgi:2-haloacid dehalogenase